MEKTSNLTVAQVDEETRKNLIYLFMLYNKAGSIYKEDTNANILIYLITQYYKFIKPDYNNMIYSFKRKYISNESLVEKNDTPEEKEGLKLVYDYIQKFDINRDYFNIFVTALELHSLLYRPLDQKNIEEKKAIQQQIEQLQKEAKQERNIEKYKQAKELSKIREHVTFGGRLRNGGALMQEFVVEVPSPEEASKIFNSYLNPDKVEEYQKMLETSDIITYINYVVNTTADLIGLQPFADGNKRTFRGLLNLMLKKKNLPPVFIVKKERNAYHEALEKAIKLKDYRDLDVFYYYKICNSIFELDFLPFLNEANMDIKEFNLEETPPSGPKFN